MISPSESSDEPADDESGRDEFGSELMDEGEINGPAIDELTRLFADCEPGLRAMLSHRLRSAADVDDCLQNVFLKLVSKGEPVQSAARRAWLFRVASNEAAQFWRKEELKKRSLEKVADDQATEVSAEGISELQLREFAQQAEAALQTLPESTRRVITMRLNDNLTFQEIAQQLEIPLGTALTRMRRGLAKLRTLLDTP